MTTAPVLNRRDFLKTGAAGSAALVIGFHVPSSALAAAEDQEKKTPKPFNAWVRITPDNHGTLILGKSEMGQGAMTALPMILAEELYLDWKQVSVEQAPTNPKIYDHGTGGSGSVAGSWLPLRRAGAAAREMLVAAAAQRWNVSRDTCKAQSGGVLHGARKQFLTYGELVEDAAKLPVPDLNTVPLKNPDDFTIVGHDRKRFEAAAKSTGAAKFGIDARPAGMQYAVIARCPVFGGKLAKFDAAKAKQVPGVRDVFPIDPVGEGAFTAGGVVVLADNSWAAVQGRKALDITWDEGPNAGESSESLRKHFIENAAQPGKVVRNEGDADSAGLGGKKGRSGVRAALCRACLHGADELHRAHPAGRRGSVGAHASAAMGAAGDCQSFRAFAGESERAHNLDGRRLRPSLSGRLCHGSRASSQSYRQAGDGSVDSRRRHAARFLSSRVVS